MRISNVHRRNGFTVAEAMIAMVVLATAAAAIVLPFSAGAAAHAEGAKQTMAAQLAAELLERLKSEPYDELEPIYDEYVEAQGAMFDPGWQPYTDEAYRRFWRRCTCTKANVGGQARWWVTAYVYYDNNEVVRMSTLIGP
ncbi:MAG: type IV pilus modification PilV family protein [Anaerohalosphaeraceae bacterium]|jgi:Tfp pilus assembly protein PilV